MGLSENCCGRGDTTPGGPKVLSAGPRRIGEKGRCEGFVVELTLPSFSSSLLASTNASLGRRLTGAALYRKKVESTGDAAVRDLRRHQSKEISNKRSTTAPPTAPPTAAPIWLVVEGLDRESCTGVGDPEKVAVDVWPSVKEEEEDGADVDESGGAVVEIVGTFVANAPTPVRIGVIVG